MGSSAKLLGEYIRQITGETKHGDMRRLRVFDFDDTLVKTDAMVHVTEATGQTFDLTPGEFAVYDKQLTDTFDYSDFQRLINPRKIMWTNRILCNVYKHHGPKGLVVLSARSHPEPILEFLANEGLESIEVVALDDASPEAKVSWIDARITEAHLDMVEYFDDSHKNVAAVKALQHKHPDVTIVSRHIVQHRISAAIRRA